MITIAGIALPECAIWQNEMEYGMPISAVEPSADGRQIVFVGGHRRNIDIYIPKIAGELTRQTAVRLKTLAENGGTVFISINGQDMTAVFRHCDNSIDLKPINAKQTQDNSDSYYGTIRLLEV